MERALSPMDVFLRELIKVEERGRDRLTATVCYPPTLQGPPESGHGGGTTAILFELARMLCGEADERRLLPRPVRIDVTLHRAMPLETALSAEVVSAGEGWRSRISGEGKLIAEAEIRAGSGSLAALPLEDRRAWEGACRTAFPVPAYEYCLGCGLKNPRGAQVRFEYNDDWMWKRLTPQAHFRTAGGDLAPGYAAIVGDELGWWLGALRQGECGLSSRISLTLGPAVPHGTPLIAVGSRRAVTTDDPKGRIWRAPVALLTEDWQPVAAAEVQFAGSRVFTKMMLPRFLWDSDHTALLRAFPRLRDELPDALPAPPNAPPLA